MIHDPFPSLKAMRQSGQLDRLWAKWKANPPEGCLGDGAEALAPEALLAVFLLLLLAAGLSGLVLLGELGLDKVWPHCSKGGATKVA